MNIGVIGGSICSKRVYRIAQRLGELIAEERWILICGGHFGVMEAVCKGAKSKGGTTVGILPSYDGKDANHYVDIKIPTGLGYGRNIIVVRASDVLIAINGRYGTLSEIAFALSEEKVVLGIESWGIKGVIKVSTPLSAVRYIKRNFVKNES